MPTLVALFSGSSLSEKTKDSGINDVISEIAHRLNPSLRDKTWKIFPGTGTEGNWFDAFVGLFIGRIGENNVHKMSTIAAHWIDNCATTTNEPVTVIMVCYSRGCITANLTSHKISNKNVNVVFIFLDPVAGICGDSKMVPIIAGNVSKHIALYAEYAVLPLFHFFLTHVPEHLNPDTQYAGFTLPVDHGPASGTIVTFWKPEQFVLKSGPTKNPIADLICLALEKMNVSLKTADSETALKQWINWGTGETTLFRKKLFHVNNYARKHDRDISYFKCAGILLIALIASLLTPSPLNVICSLTIILLFLATLYAIYKTLTPLNRIAKPLMPKNNLSPENIRDNVEGFLKLFDQEKKNPATENGRGFSI